MPADCLRLAARLAALSALASWALAPAANAQERLAPEPFDGRYGQVEVGGPYAGVEFHHSRPLPVRFSFFAPVANSIDQSADYWRRDASQPLRVEWLLPDEPDSVQAFGTEALPYRWTPARVDFAGVRADRRVAASYRFGERLPFAAVRLVFRNTLGRARRVGARVRLFTGLRTSHAYEARTPGAERFSRDGRVYTARFDSADTGPAAVFVVAAGEAPTGFRTGSTGSPGATLTFGRTLAPGDSLDVTLLVGTTAPEAADSVARAVQSGWHADADAYEASVARYADAAYLRLPDPALAATARWSRAVLAANRHYLAGEIVPMPCPAEYNFYFTHDVLLTDLGAVLTDPGRVRQDLRSLIAHARPDSSLPHARYWRGGQYVTEWAGADNWNNLWLPVVAAAYLRHSADTATVAALYPLIEKGMGLVLGAANDGTEGSGVLEATRPDWWDIGHRRGPRVYLTALGAHALRAQAALAAALGRAEAPALRARADSMQQALRRTFWDARTGYLMNPLDSATADPHLYSGSLLAAAFDLLPPADRRTLLRTARARLLDPHLGIRNAVPMDFHTLEAQYGFLPGEAGAPGLYMNGGVWPHGTAWYVLGLLADGRPDAAGAALRRYLSLEGIRHSPHGQPAFYEYRNALPASERYGEIDKPTFLWMGGWYLRALYTLAGVRTDATGQVTFAPALPAGFRSAAFDLALGGDTARVAWRGTGRTLRRIVVDGRPSASAVAPAHARRIVLVRGTPRAPYLAGADCAVVCASATARRLRVVLRGEPGERVRLEVVAPGPVRRVAWQGRAVAARVRHVDCQGREGHTAGTVRSTLWLRLPAREAALSLAL